MGEISPLETDEAIEESRQARDDFLELAGRELKTPAASVIGWAQYAQRLLARGAIEETQEKLEMVVRESRRVARLVEAFADMVRVRQKGFGLQLEPADLRPLLEFAVQAAEAAYSAHHFSIELPESPVSSLIDSPAIGTVFGSLLENAVKFSAPDGPVNVALHVRENEAVVSVHDEGIGIPAGKIAGIFARYEAPIRATRRNEGTGLSMGLYLSRALVAAHHGQIWVESPGSGQGSTFYVSLPLNQ
jgi:two-component system CheB/CheR fusion protein